MVNILTVFLILALTKIHNLNSKVVDCELTFLQADPEEDTWMQLLIGFQVAGQTGADSDKYYVLNLNKNLYGLKQGKLQLV